MSDTCLLQASSIILHIPVTLACTSATLTGGTAAATLMNPKSSIGIVFMTVLYDCPFLWICSFETKKVTMQ